MKQGWITDNFGDKFHYVDGINHNDNGPAIIYSNGTKVWINNCERHRLDGPAIKSYNGNKSWWYKGKWIGDSLSGYTQDKFEQWLRLQVFA